MKLLLDTHLLLWGVIAERRLSAAALELLQNPENELLFSVVSIWELAIKHGAGRKDFVVDPGLLRRSLLDHGYTELPLTSDHAVAVGSLPHIHKDPFDRVLVAQALIEGITLLTSDPMVAKYPGSIRRL